jgi:hypothetical protein
VRSWERASFQFNTHSPRRRPKIRPRDLLLPAHHNPLKLLAACVASGVSVSILYAWFPMVFFSIAFNKSIGPRIWLIVLGVAVVTSVVLFVASLRQMARYREYATQI